MKKIKLQTIKKALSDVYDVYMMKGSLRHLATLNVNGIRRIDWSGCDL